ncbi:MAG: 2-oxoacid:acceptor oxidoreductase family protein [Acidimicrobiales bacterium]
MEHEVLMTGIGGQGIQLAAQVLARAAVAEGLQTQLFGSYAGMMRGGSTEATLVMADGPIDAPPTVDRAWCAVLMHHEHASGTLARVRPGGLVLVNATVFEGVVETSGTTVVELPATDLAVQVGHLMTASMVMMGALSARTGIVGLGALEDAVAEALPPYRAQHVALNVAALRAGHDAGGELAQPTVSAQAGGGRPC